MFEAAWTIARKGIVAFIDDNAVSCGAAIAFHVVTSFVSALIVAVAPLGAVFGESLIHPAGCRADESLRHASRNGGAIPAHSRGGIGDRDPTPADHGHGRPGDAPIGLPELPAISSTVARRQCHDALQCGAAMELFCWEFMVELMPPLDMGLTAGLCFLCGFMGWPAI